MSRKKNESFWIGSDVKVTVVEIRGDKVRLGIEAPTDIPVHRDEVYLAIAMEHQRNADSAAALIKPAEAPHFTG